MEPLSSITASDTNAIDIPSHFRLPLRWQLFEMAGRFSLRKWQRRGFSFAGGAMIRAGLCLSIAILAAGANWAVAVAAPPEPPEAPARFSPESIELLQAISAGYD